MKLLYGKEQTDASLQEVIKHLINLERYKITTTPEKLFVYPENDMLYLITDGMQDQFGGPEGKKFMLSNLTELLIKISRDSVEEQHRQIETALIEWKGDLAQVDDITIMGIRVSKDLI